MSNPKINIKKTEVLSDNWYTFKKITYDYQKEFGELGTHYREAYERGNGATILLYNKQHGTVILTRQFRLSTCVNGNSTGMLIKSCTGLLGLDNPEDCIKIETEEETGYKIEEVKKVFEAYMSSGSVTEILYFFVAQYNNRMKISAGGDLTEQQENIEVSELPFDKAYDMISTGEIKYGKTIILLQNT